MNNDWKKTHIIYWSDERHEDFNEVGLSRPPVPEDYPYIRKNPINNFFSNLLYFVVAVPILGLGMLFKGIRVKGRENLRFIKHQGAFIYANHVALSDVTKYQTLVFPTKRVNILGYSDTLSIPVVKHIARALGFLPLPLKGDIKNMVNLSNAFKYYTKEKKQHILIFPEAHIWPFYTKVRNFTNGSFYYPAYAYAPVLPIVTTWRKPLIGKYPKQTLIIGEPIFPKENLDVNENKAYLHQECLKRMQEIADNNPQYEYIKYIYQEKKEK